MIKYLAGEQVVDKCLFMISRVCDSEVSGTASWEEE
jgi:hypothetical protein